MITIPVFDIILAPDVKYLFSGDFYRDLTGTEPVEGEELLLLPLKEEKNYESFTKDDFFPIGIYTFVESVDKDGTACVYSKYRIDILDMKCDGTAISSVSYSIRDDIRDISVEEELSRFEDVKSAYMQFFAEQEWGFVARGYLNQWDNMSEMAASLSSRFEFPIDERYAILKADLLSERLEHLEKLLYSFLVMTKVGNEAESEAAAKNERLYREESVKRQIEILQRELDNMHPEKVTDVRRFEVQIQDSEMNDEARKEAQKVLGRMKQEGQNSPEYGILYDYLDFVTSLQWKTPEVFEPIDLKTAATVLDADHYGLKKPKERILQHIAVMNKKKTQSGSILLFVGAPGTGKTSIGQSIAHALGRAYTRVSLGGVRDEAEIRGHRRTYIGAMPGRIMDGIRKSGSSNPVMVLDEVDKLSHDFSGDPASALLEVLDPEQNNSFTDHYMNVPYDLSDVFFICTANSLDTIPQPLLDRMEIIEFQGYTPVEKLHIAKEHLIPKSLKEHGILKKELKYNEDAIREIISGYTMEAGVRGLRKQIDQISRKTAYMIEMDERKSITVSSKKLKEFLGIKPNLQGKVSDTKQPGIVTGLAWTGSGGDILSIETMMTEGEGKIKITGQLGDVMQESAQIAISLAKHRYPEQKEYFETHDLHIHVPEGAVPKDGPSAGVTMSTAICSLISGKPVAQDIAMTGEISLRGKVMPIGGLNEKLMAAERAGVRTVLIPIDNVQDLEEISEEVKQNLQILPMKTLDDILKFCKCI